MSTKDRIVGLYEAHAADWDADQRRMFARFAAHARPGAPLMFTSGPEHGEAISS